MSLTATAFVPLSSRRHWRRRYEDCFAALAPPSRDSLVGRFQGEFVGPWWLRHGAPVLLAVLGMRGWWGKDFSARGEGLNLVRRREGLRPAVPVVLREAPSRVDGQRGVQVEYPPGCAWYWRLFVDELRWLEGETVLAMSRLELPLLRRLRLPFLLHRVAPTG
jgi:hypothetical protein